MKKSYEKVARFARWVVAGIVSFIIAIPALFSFSTSV